MEEVVEVEIVKKQSSPAISTPPLQLNHQIHSPNNSTKKVLLVLVL
jgi:hypothetical protein